jgi:hypothetical protein
MLRKLLAAPIFFVATVAAAATYYFHISAAGPAYADYSLQTDSDNFYEGANKVARTYLHYINPMSMITGLWDGVYISYADGKIAKFETISTRETIRLRFVSEVPTLPPGIKNGTPTKPPGAGSATGGEDYRTFERHDFRRGDDDWMHQRERRGSWEIGEIREIMERDQECRYTCR